VWAVCEVRAPPPTSPCSVNVTCAVCVLCLPASRTSASACKTLNVKGSLAMVVAVNERAAGALTSTCSWCETSQQCFSSQSGGECIGASLEHACHVEVLNNDCSTCLESGCCG